MERVSVPGDLFDSMLAGVGRACATLDWLDAPDEWRLPPNLVEVLRFLAREGHGDRAVTLVGEYLDARRRGGIVGRRVTLDDVLRGLGAAGFTTRLIDQLREELPAYVGTDVTGR